MDWQGRTHFPKHLRIAGKLGYELHPNLIEAKNGKTIHVIDASVIRLLSQHLGFSYEIYIPADNALGEPLPDGNWTGMVGMVQRGQCDIALGGLSPSPERSKVVHFAYPYHYTPITFVTDKPEYLSKNLAIIYPFSLNMWIALAVSFISVCVSLYLLVRRQYNFQTVVLSVFGILVGNSQKLRVKKSGLRMFWISWAVAVVFIVNGYKAVLLAFISFPSLAGIRTIRDLSLAARDPSFRCFTYQGSLVYESLVNSADKTLADCIKRHSKAPLDQYEFLSNSSYRKALIWGRSFLTVHEKDFFFSDDVFYYAPTTIAVDKGFCCTRLLDDFVHKATAVGLFQKYEKDLEFFIGLSSLSVSSQDSNKKLTLNDISGAFFMLVIGLTLSFFVLLVEIIFKKKKNNEQDIFLECSCRRTFIKAT